MTERFSVSMRLLHKSFGFLAAVLVLVRLVSRLFHQLPAFPSALPSIQKRVVAGS